MRKAGVTPQATAAGPGSPVLRSIAGPPARPAARVTRIARVPSAQDVATAAAATQATGRGAAAASGSFRGRRRG